MAKNKRIDLGVLQQALDAANEAVLTAIEAKERADAEYEVALKDLNAARVTLRQASIDVVNS